MVQALLLSLDDHKFGRPWRLGAHLQSGRRRIGLQAESGVKRFGQGHVRDFQAVACKIFDSQLVHGRLLQVR